MFKAGLFGAAAFGFVATAAPQARAQSFTTLFTFDGTDGASAGGLLYSQGLLYGVSQYGGNTTCGLGCGVLFSVNITSGAETVLYQFGGKAHGAGPVGSLVAAGQFLYGVTSSGGASGNGTAFKFNPATGKFTTLHSFAGGADGAYPLGLYYQGGALYGTTANGGPANDGTLFKINPANGSESVLYGFTDKADGGRPNGQMIYKAGALYGTTQAGGIFTPCNYGCGVLFAFNLASSAESTVYSFKGHNGKSYDGYNPSGALLYQAGVIYGTTTYGGADHEGTFFSVKLANGKEKVLHDFAGEPLDAGTPAGALASLGGLIYGAAEIGGASNYGALYSIDPATGAESLDYSVTGGAEGYFPAGLIAQAGNLYGFTTGNGYCTSACGTIFKYAP